MNVAAMTRQQLFEKASEMGLRTSTRDSTDRLRSKVARAARTLTVPPTSIEDDHPGYVIQHSDKHRGLFEVLDLSVDAVVFEDERYEVCEAWVENQ